MRGGVYCYVPYFVMRRVMLTRPYFLAERRTSGGQNLPPGVPVVRIGVKVQNSYLPASIEFDPTYNSMPYIC